MRLNFFLMKITVYTEHGFKIHRTTVAQLKTELAFTKRCLWTLLLCWLVECRTQLLPFHFWQHLRAYESKRASYTGAVLGSLSSLVRSELPSVVCQSLVNVTLFNARSVNNKALLLSDIIADRKLDLLFITQTWHKQNDGLLFNQITPEGYGL